MKSSIRLPIAGKLAHSLRLIPFQTQRLNSAGTRRHFIGRAQHERFEEDLPFWKKSRSTAFSKPGQVYGKTGKVDSRNKHVKTKSEQNK